MMVIHLYVASTFNIEIKKTVHTKECQHMVHEGNAGAYGSGAKSIKFEAQPDICFFRLAMYFTDSGCIAHKGCSSVKVGLRSVCRDKINSGGNLSAVIPHN